MGNDAAAKLNAVFYKTGQAARSIQQRQLRRLADGGKRWHAGQPLAQQWWKRMASSGARWLSGVCR